MPKSLEELELRPAEVQQLLDKPPQLLLRLGQALLLLFVLGLLAAASLIKYPDTLESRASIQATQAQEVVVSGANGFLVNTPEQQEYEVDKGETMARLASTQNGRPFAEVEAPTEGYAYWVSFHEAGSRVQASDTLFIILPAKNTYFATIELPSEQFQQIEIGQEVFISLDPYPAETYGSLKARVSQLIPYAEKGSIHVKATFTNGLITENGNELRYLPNLSGQAILTTADLTLLDRLLSRKKKMFVKGKDG